jgi:hypothetical protein
MYRHELEAELSSASEPEPLSLDDKWKRMEEAVRKELFDEKCEKANEEKNACRANANQR